MGSLNDDSVRTFLTSWLLSHRPEERKQVNKQITGLLVAKVQRQHHLSECRLSKVKSRYVRPSIRRYNDVIETMRQADVRNGNTKKNVQGDAFPGQDIFYMITIRNMPVVKRIQSSIRMHKAKKWTMDFTIRNWGKECQKSFQQRLQSRFRLYHRSSNFRMPTVRG